MRRNLDTWEWNNGVKTLCGVDEVGRGALAGPVVAASVILKPFSRIPGLDDSKKLSPKKREKLFKKIRKKAIVYAVALADWEEIDRINIREASFKAMRKAISKLRVSPELVFVDGFEIPNFSSHQKGIPKGDSKSSSIAAASILAKVTRDRMMKLFHLRYPNYNFKTHKGYPTKEHIKNLHLFGPCPIHRRTYRPVRECFNSVLKKQ